jgi:glycosyltransferase involved in cell wall biosynthesis
VGESGLNRQVFLLGSRYKHHAAHSGYEGFSRYIGTRLRYPVNVRFRTNYLGWRIDRAITKLTSRPYYSLGLLINEGVAAFHMFCHKEALYHAIYGDTDLWVLPQIKSMTKNRLIATFHDPPSILKWLAIDKLAPLLDGVILVSESQRAFFEELFLPCRIFHVPHGIDTDFFKPEGLSDKPICITVGSKLRDFETLRRAAELVLSSNPHVRIIAVGSRIPGGENPQLHDERFEFLDDLTDNQLRLAYQRSRVAIFSFQDATANNALLEAMACGLPIVATDVGGVREYIGCQAGLLCEPGNSESFAAAILQVLNDKTLASEMSHASRSRAVKYDYRMVANQMTEVYTQIVERKSTV